MAGRKLSIAGEIVKEYLSQYPNHGDMTLAKIIYKKHPESFNTIESARSLVRMYRGHSGEEARKANKDKSFRKPVQYKYNAWADLPEEFDENFEPFEIHQSKTLILSDLHIPYHSNSAIATALEYGYNKGVNCILINGDLLDMPNHSRFERDWRNRTTAEEFEMTRQFLKKLRTDFPKAKIVFKEGNHCERFEKWLYVKAPEIFDVPDFQLEIILRLGELKIDIVKDKRPVEIGKLTVLHGHEFIGGGSGGVNPARGTFLKTLNSVLVGHYHKRSVHDEMTMKSELISVNSTGCLCQLHPLYARINKWGHGFAYVELDINSGEYRLENLKIINGKVY